MTKALGVNAQAIDRLSISPPRLTLREPATNRDQSKIGLWSPPQVALFRRRSNRCSAAAGPPLLIRLPERTLAMTVSPPSCET